MPRQERRYGKNIAVAEAERNAYINTVASRLLEVSPDPDELTWEWLCDSFDQILAMFQKKGETFEEATDSAWGVLHDFTDIRWESLFDEDRSVGLYRTGEDSYKRLENEIELARRWDRTYQKSQDMFQQQYRESDIETEKPGYFLSHMGTPREAP